MVEEILFVIFGATVRCVVKDDVRKEAIVGEILAIVFVLGVALVLHFWVDRVVVDILKAVEFVLIGWVPMAVVRWMRGM